MTITESKIAGRGYYGTLPRAEGDGADLAARYYDALRAAVTELFVRECEVPHTSCTCGFTQTEQDGAVTVTVTLRRRTAGRTTAERTYEQTWERYGGNGKNDFFLFWKNSLSPKGRHRKNFPKIIQTESKYTR